MQHRKTLNQKMLEHAALQQRSGETIASYAKQIGVPCHKMQYWVSNYKAQQSRQHVESSTSLKFIDLSSFQNQNQSVITDSHPEFNDAVTISPIQDKRLPQITLSFPNGMCLKIY